MSSSLFSQIKRVVREVGGKWIRNTDSNKLLVWPWWVCLLWPEIIAVPVADPLSLHHTSLVFLLCWKEKVCYEEIEWSKRGCLCWLLWSYTTFFAKKGNEIDKHVSWEEIKLKNRALFIGSWKKGGGEGGKLSLLYQANISKKISCIYIGIPLLTLEFLYYKMSRWIFLNNNLWASFMFKSLFWTFFKRDQKYAEFLVT